MASCLVEEAFSLVVPGSVKYQVYLGDENSLGNRSLAFIIPTYRRTGFSKGKWVPFYMLMSINIKFSFYKH